MPVSPATEQGTGLCRLELAADASWLATARLFSGAVARGAGCDAAAVEDVKLAVSEACTPGIQDSGSSQAALTIDAEIREDDVRFVVTSPGRPGLRFDDVDVPSHLDVISGLYPGAREEPSGDAWAVTFTVRPER